MSRSLLLTCCAPVALALAGLLLASSVGFGQPTYSPPPTFAPPQPPAMKTSPVASKAFELLVAGFEKRGWKFSPLPEQLALTTNFTERNGNYNCVAQVLTRPNGDAVVCFYARLGFSVPESMRASAAEFIARANWGLLAGNFEMDYATGALRYKTSCSIADGELTAKMVQALVAQNLGTADRYFPGLMKMVSGQASPQVAIEEVERPALASPPQTVPGVTHRESGIAVSISGEGSAVVGLRNGAEVWRHRLSQGTAQSLRLDNDQVIVMPEGSAFDVRTGRLLRRAATPPAIAASPPSRHAANEQTDLEKTQLQELVDLAKVAGEDQAKVEAIKQYWASAIREERTAYYRANIEPKPAASGDGKK